MTQNGISVIICSYNGACRLPQTIEHLALQEIPNKICWEVILVDNASTDNTAETARNEWFKYSGNGTVFKTVLESKPGLSHAREKGIQTSKFDYIIFCDDDNWLDKNYIKIAFETISKNPQIAALGGQSTAVSTIPLPGWFEAAKQNYAVGQQASSSQDVSYRKYLWGSGIVIRKEVYIKAFSGFPSLLTGRNGKELSSGEDSEMCMRFLLMGYRLFYTEKLAFKHFISLERITEDYNKNLVTGFIKAHEILKIYAEFIDNKNLSSFKKFTDLVKSALRILISGLTNNRKWDIEAEKAIIFKLSGISFKTVDKKIVLIKHFTRTFA